MIRPFRAAKSIAAIRIGLGVAFLGWAMPVWASSAAGRPLSEALDALRSPEFSVMFSTELVPDALRVTIEPRPGPPADVARELLEPFGLGLKNVAPALFAVVRLDPRAAPSPTAAGGARSAPGVLPLEQVIVAASRYSLASDEGAQHLQSDDIAEQPKFADDPLRAVARLPGVTNNGDSARLNIRGGSTDEVLFLIDGFPLRQPFHVPAQQAPFSAFDAALISNIDVYTGGFPLRYGERMGGVVALDTVTPDLEPRTSLSVSNVAVGARTAGVLSEAHGVDGLVAARTGRLDNLMDHLANDMQSPTFSDGLAKLRWRPAATSAISAEMLWSQDDVALRDSARGELVHLSSHAFYLWLNGQQQVNERWRAQAWLGYSGLHSMRDGQIDNPNVVAGRVSDARNSDLWDFRWQLHGALSERQSLEFGGEWHTGDADYSYQNAVLLSPPIARLYQKPLSSTLNTMLFPYRRNAVLYFADRVRMSERVTTEWGLRAQRASGLGLQSLWLWDPRVMVSYDLNDHTRLRASWGRFHQPDGVQELRVEDGAVGFARPQSSDHTIIGLEHVDSRAIAWRAEIYEKRQAAPRARFENQLNPLAILSELEPDRVQISPSGAELRGAEISARYSNKVWSWRLGYSRARASDEIGGTDFLRSWDQTHSFAGSLDWRGGPWSLGAAYTAHTGWPTTPVHYTVAGDPTLGVRNSERWPSFASLDLRSGYRWPLRRGALLFALDITNVLDRRNSCCSELVLPPTGTAVEPLTLLPFTATLSVRWNF